MHRKIVLKQFQLRMSILGQKSCILGPTIFKVPQLTLVHMICNEITSVFKFLDRVQKFIEVLAKYVQTSVDRGSCYTIST